MSIIVKKYYTYKEEYLEELTINACEEIIYENLCNYTREAWVKCLGYIGIECSNDSNADMIFKVQSKLMSVKRHIYIIHRRATLVLVQYLFSLKSKNFNSNDVINKKDLLDVYLCINHLFDLKDKHIVHFSFLGKKLWFFNWFRSASSFFNFDDIVAAAFFIENFYSYIEKLNKKDYYNKLIKENVNIEIDNFIFLLKETSKHKSTFDILKFLNLTSTIDIKEIDEFWEQREPKLPIPFEYNLIERYPIIKIHEFYYTFDKNLVMTSLVKSIYNIICDEDKNEFKREFGIKIAEPVIFDLLRKYFLSNETI